MSTMLTINVHDKPAPLPAYLEERLNATSPTKTPEELAEALSLHSARAERLRSAHLEAVKDRAARETQRAAAAREAKLRMAAHRVDKVQRKLDYAQAKTTAALEATQAEREARRARRVEMALAVAEARQRAKQTRESRLAALRHAESLAFSKHAKHIASIVHKSSWQVKHAIAVAAAQKEKEHADAVTAAQRLTDRLEGAAHRRQPSPPTGASSPPVLHRVLNDSKVASEMRRKLHAASMDRAASKRAAILQDVVDKAGAVGARAARVVAAVHAKGKGTDAETAATRAALYDKLLRAEVAHLLALKQRTAFSTHKHGDTTSLILVPLHKATPRMPPAALSLRLSRVPHTLVATAHARQRGAASRRAALRAQATLRASQACARRAAALARVGKRRALLAAAVDAKAARALATIGLAQGRALFKVSEAHRRGAASLARRTAAAQALLQKDSARAKAADAASERAAAARRAVAKKGVVALRAAANQSRRTARAAAVTTRGQAHAAKCAAAEAKRAAVLAARVDLARKRMKAPHPKREVADMELKA